ncbi:MAG: polar amino acid ABC transporter ATP-binding protein, partial [Deltaproteobacteria bacterium]|nr:polar amino acid ABC transporter ATP-binding protein [Deltaproteobacteria bacterium]
LHEKEQMTMIIVTHEIHFVKNVANRVMLVQDSGIAETSDPKTFFENPKDERTRKFLRSIINVQ